MATQNPILIPVILPNYNIGSGGDLDAPLLGHAAFIIIDENGGTTYQEFGRYDPNKVPGVVTINKNSYTEGNIRQYQIVTKLEYDADGNLTEKSLTAALDEVFNTSGLYKNVDIGAASVTQFKMSSEQSAKISIWFDEQKKLINDGTTHYSIFDKNCMQFVYDAAKAAGLTISNSQNLPGLAIPSIGAANILEVAKKGYEYFAPGSWVKDRMTTIFGPGTRTANFLQDRVWQAAKAVSEWFGVKQPTITLVSSTAQPIAEIKDSLGSLLQRTSIEEGGTLKNVTFDNLSNKTREALLNPNGSLSTLSTFSPAGILTKETKWSEGGARTERVFESETGKLSSHKEFDALGRKAVDIAFRPDGTATKTTLDLTNTKPWDQAIGEFDRDGRLVGEKVVNDNGTRYDAKFNPATGKMTEKTEFNVSDKATAKTTFRSDGTTSKVLFDPENKETWKDAVVEYDKNGKPLTQTGTNDDGSTFTGTYQPGTTFLNKLTTTRTDGTKSQTLVDVADTKDWDEATIEYAKDGSLVSEDGTMDDGTSYKLTYDRDTGEVNRRVDFNQQGQKVSDIVVNHDGTQLETHYDVNNKQAWREATLHYDKNGKLVFEKGTIDDGSKYDQKYDPATGRTTERTEYNPADRVTSITSFRTDGTKSKTLYDPENKQPWKEATVEYRKDGSLISEKGVNDNATRYDLTFDKDTGQITQRQEYDAAGQKTSITTFRTDGTQSRKFFDVGNKQGWKEATVEYDKNGKVVSETGVIDDGSRYTQKYDPVTGRTTERGEYTADGKMTSKTTFNADGSEIRTEYDTDGTKPWSERTLNFDKNGRLQSISGILDDGTRMELTYDSNGNITLERRYDKSGNLIYDSVEEAKRKAAAEEFIKQKLAERHLVTLKDADDKFTWDTKVRTYDGFGQLIRETIDFGKGANSHVEKDFDLSGTGPWRERIRTIYKDGTLVHEFIIRNDGTSRGTAYNRKTGKKEGYTEYDKNGYAIATDQKYPGTLPPVFVDLPIPYLAQQMETRGMAGEFDPHLPDGSDGLPPGWWQSGSTGPRPTTTSGTRPNLITSSWGTLGVDVNGDKDIYPRRYRADFYSDGTKVMNWSDGTKVVFDKNDNLVFRSTGNTTDIGGPPKTSPILLDLNRDNLIDLRPLDLLSASSTPHFDWNGDGTPDKTAWVGPDDGLLVIDLGKSGATGPDGTIDQAREIAFSLWKTEAALDAEIKASVTDLEGLRFAFDTNRDDVLDARDARWADFRIWQDRNQDGVSDPGELFGLDELGIKLINLLPDPEGARQFADGSVITGTTTALLADGSTMLVGDAALRFQPSHATHQMA